MDIFSSSIDLTRIVFLIGALMALLYKKQFGVTPGGIIVPGTLACILFMSFTTFLLVLLSSLLCMLIYKVFFGSYPLSKRWSSLINISISLVLGLGFMAIARQAGMLDQELVLFSMVVPGLISISVQRYKFGKVMLGTLTVTALSCLLGVAASKLIPYEMLTTLSVQLAAYQPLMLSNPYFVLPISIAMAALIYFKFGIRGGGYLISPFMAAVAISSPIQALLIFVGVAISYLLIRLALRFTLIVGLERFVLSIFCAYLVITAMDIVAVTIGIPDYRPAAIVLIIAVAVMTNDLSLQSPKSTIKNGMAPSLITSYLARLAV